MESLRATVKGKSGLIWHINGQILGYSEISPQLEAALVGLSVQGVSMGRDILEALPSFKGGEELSEEFMALCSTRLRDHTRRVFAAGQSRGFGGVTL